MVILPLAFMLSCKDNDPAPANDGFTKLSSYLVDNEMDLNNILDGFIIAAPATEAEVPAFLAGYHVMDIRSASDFTAGHIEGAENSSLGSIVADAASITEPILVVCYTGQTAAHAVVALRLSGHSDAQVLKWGMSGWNSANSGPWSGATSSQAVGHAGWTTDATADLQDYDYPVIDSDADGAALLAERVTAMTSKGFQGIAAADVLASPSTYAINNYWDQASVDSYGHIVGAIRNNPMTLSAESFKHLDASKTVVTYCWTGQTSSMITAYLTVMGYDAKSLKFGANSMIYDELESHKFVPTDIVDLPVVTD